MLPGNGRLGWRNEEFNASFESVFSGADCGSCFAVLDVGRGSRGEERMLMK